MFLFIFVLQTNNKNVENPIKLQQNSQQGRLFVSLIGDGYRVTKTKPSGQITMEKRISESTISTIVLIPKSNNHE